MAGAIGTTTDRVSLGPSQLGPARACLWVGVRCACACVLGSVKGSGSSDGPIQSARGGRLSNEPISPRGACGKKESIVCVCKKGRAVDPSQ